MRSDRDISNKPCVSPRANARRWPSPGIRRAFTLIEVMVVVIVIGVLAGLLIPNFAASGAKNELRAAADRLALTARFAHERAVRRGVDHRLVLLPHGTDGGPGFRIEAVTSDAASSEGYDIVNTGGLRPARLPDRLAFLDVQIAGETPSTDGRRMIRFRAAGDADAAAVVIGNGAQAYTLLVWPNTGRVQLLPYAVPRLPNEREDLDV